MFYKVDSTRVSLREYWWECRAPWLWPVFVIGVVLKLLHVRIPSSVDDVTTDELGPYRVRESDLEPEVLNKMLPRETALGELGFHSPVYHAINDSFQKTAYRLSTLQHDSDRAFSQIHFRLWSRRKPAKESLFISFVTPFRDGTYLVTTGGRRDLMAPPECEVNYRTGADIEDLWSAHQEALESTLQMKQIRPVDSQAKILSSVEGLHRLCRDFHVRRGVFVPLTPSESAKIDDKTAVPASFADVDDTAFLNELTAQEASGGGWRRAIIILAVSLLLFVSAGSLAWSRTFALAIVPILFFHELGHYVAMRVFGYKNLKMFFIPLFGAAVTGRSYNVAGWKKAIVSLMGPVPGIFLGTVMGVVGIVLGQKMLLAAAILMLVLNGLNLLPLLPLDGGWVAHTLIFSRHSLLDVAFRICTVFLLLGLSALTGDRVWMYLGIATAVSIPWAYRVATIAKKIRKKGIAAVSADGKTIDPAAAVQIFHEIRAASPTGIKPKQGAQLTMQIFDALNNRPPGIAATFLLGMLHLSAFVTAIVFGAIFVVAQSGNVRDFLLAAVSSPTVPLNVAEIQQTAGAQPAENVKVLIGQFGSPAEARQTFKDLSATLPPSVAATCFGDHVFVAVPHDDGQLREQLLTKMEQKCKQAFVAQQEGSPWLRISCLAPSAEAATKLEEECNLYFNVPHETYLVPPWSAKNGDLRDDDVKGRRTWRFLRESPVSSNDPEYAEAAKKLARAFRRGDSDAVKTAQTQLKQIAEKHRASHIRRLQDEHPGDVRKEVIDLFATQPEPPQVDEDSPDVLSVEAYKKHEKEMAAWHSRVGALMGQLPMQDGKPAASELRHSALSGHCSRAGLLLTSNFISFHRIDQAAPAFVTWLSQHGCNDFKYSVDSGFGDINPDELNAEE